MIEQPPFLEDKSLCRCPLYLPEISQNRAGFAFRGFGGDAGALRCLSLLGQDYLEQGIVASALKGARAGFQASGLIFESHLVRVAGFVQARKWGIYTNPWLSCRPGVRNSSGRACVAGDLAVSVVGQPTIARQTAA